MSAGVVVLDSDILSELSRGHAAVVAHANHYLKAHGRLTFTAVTVFERIRGYRAAIRDGRPFEPQLRQFEALIASSLVLPVDLPAAERAGKIWARLDRRGRRAIEDVLIAAVASVRGLPLVTRNRRDFGPIAERDEGLTLLDWTR